jgi:hypothetical protein
MFRTDCIALNQVCDRSLATMVEGGRYLPGSALASILPGHLLAGR